MKKILIFVGLLFAVLFGLNVKIEARSTPSYTYDYYNQILAAPPAYHVDDTLTPARLGLDALTRFRDVKFTDDYFFLLTNRNFYIYNLDYELLYALDSFDSEDTEADRLQNASYFDIHENYLYITDYNPDEVEENGEPIYALSRILVFNILDDEPINLEYEKIIRLRMDQNIPGVSKVGFHPRKIEINHAGRIFVNADGVYEGIIELDFNGNFKKFVGTNEVQISAIEAFWKKINPKSQVGRELHLPVSFSNFSVDSMGFVYATTSSEGVKPIQRFNYKGDDVLIENGNTKVIGDIYDEKGVSKFNDVAINDYGIYIILSLSTVGEGLNKTSNNKIFAYNDNGELLYVLGASGLSSAEAMENPRTIKWAGEKIIVVDPVEGAGRILIYDETAYGKNINLATYHYYKGEFELSKGYWEQALKMNSNNDLAYVGIGKAYYQENDYHEAIKYFKLGNNKFYYSKAYNRVLRDNMRKYFPVVMVLIGVGVAYSIGKKGYRAWKDLTTLEKD